MLESSVDANFYIYKRLLFCSSFFFLLMSCHSTLKTVCEGKVTIKALYGL